MATLMCLEIEKIYKDEKNRRSVSMALAALSIAGAVVATVLSGGAASPLLVAAIGSASIAIGVGSGTYNYMVAKSQETHYEQSTVAGSFDQQIGQDLINQYHFEGNAELVGIAASFAPGVGKGLFYAGEKTGVNLMIRTEAELLKDAIKSAPLFEKAAQYSKPVTDVFAKIGAGKSVALTELQAGLASKVSPKTAKVMISTFNAMTKDMGYNASMVFAVHALSHPDPYSEQGILDCLESLVMAQGISAVGAAGKNYLMQKRPGLFNSGSVNHFDFDGKIARTTDGFEQANLMRQKEAFEKFKKDVNFESMKPSEKRAFLDRLYEAHKKGAITEKGKPNGEKAAALSGIRDEIKAGLLRDNPGMSEAEAKKRALAILDGITNEDIALLGLKQKAKSIYEGPKGKVQESNQEASAYIKPEDSKRIADIYSRQDLSSSEKASQAFDVAFEARIRELPLSDQKMLKDALAKAKFKVGTKVSNSGMTLKGPQEYFESVSYYQTLMGEMEGQIQLKIKTNPSLRRAYQRYLSAPGKFLYALEEGAMRSEWSFLNSIPKDSKEAIITEIGGWRLSTGEKNKLIASLRNSDLTVDDYLKNQRGLFGEGSKIQTAMKANFSAKGFLPYATKNLIWWKVCENIFTDDYAGQTDEAIETSEVYKNICKFAAIPALVR
jgi:hypothetical protein